MFINECFLLQVVVLPLSSRVSSMFMNLDYCQCGVSVPVCFYVGFLLALTQNMLVNGLALFLNRTAFMITAAVHRYKSTVFMSDIY